MAGVGGRGDIPREFPSVGWKSQTPRIAQIFKFLFKMLAARAMGWQNPSPISPQNCCLLAEVCLRQAVSAKLSFLTPNWFFPPKIHFCWEIPGGSSSFGPNPWRGDLFLWLFLPLPPPAPPSPRSRFPPIANKGKQKLNL